MDGMGGMNRMNRSYKLIPKVLVGLAVLLIVGVALAQDKTAPKNEKEEAKLPPSGLLAGSMMGGYGKTGMPAVWGTDGMADGAEAPVNGSVSRVDRTTWELKLFNNSEDIFRINVQVEQYDAANKVVKSDPMFFAIKGKDQARRLIPSHPNAAQAALILRSWKREVKGKSRTELEKEIDATKQKLAELEGQLKPLVSPAASPAKGR